MKTDGDSDGGHSAAPSGAMHCLGREGKGVMHNNTTAISIVGFPGILRRLWTCEVERKNSEKREKKEERD